MQSLYPQNWEGFLPVFLIFLRFLGLFLLIPGFSHSAVPARMKILLSLVMALGLYPVLRGYIPPVTTDAGTLFVYVVRELVIGFVMGLAAYITFEALALGAQFVGTQMGFGVGNLFDPSSDAHASVLVVLKGWAVLMIFFALNIHHQIIHVFVTSFEFTSRVTGSHLGMAASVEAFIKMSGKLFVMAVQVAAPFTFLVLVLNAAIGVLSRMLPQMNVLLFSFPITITLGIIALYIIAPEYLDFVERALAEVTNDMVRLLKTV